MLTVCNFHYIRKDFSSKYPSIFGVTPNQFEIQMQQLSQQGSFIHPEMLERNYHEILLSKDNNILITFDDGLKEQYRFALPILNSYNIPALFFISSINHTVKKVSTVHKIHKIRSIIPSVELCQQLEFLFSKKLSSEEKRNAEQFYRYDEPSSAHLKYFLNILLDIEEQECFVNPIFHSNFNELETVEELYMNTAEITSLSKRGYIGSHAHSHIPLALYSSEQILDELKQSQDFLQNLCQVNINCVAYPYGGYNAINEQVGILASKVGYKLGFTTIPKTNDQTSNPLLLGRFDCNDLPGGKNYTKNEL